MIENIKYKLILLKQQNGLAISSINAFTFFMNLYYFCVMNNQSIINYYNSQMQNDNSIQDSTKSKIITIVRIRPNLRNEDERQCITLQNQTTLDIEISGIKRTEKVQLALPPQTTQRQVFQMIEPLLTKSMEGYNISLLTYGQTGSGKTHTMFGSDWSNIIKSQTQYVDNRKEQITFLRSVQQDQNYAGIIPRSIYLIFDRLITKRRKFIKVYCSFMQLYNEHLTDLLEDDPKLAKEQKLLIHQNKQDGIYVEGLNEIVIEDPQQCLELMRRGERNRIVRQTQMNSKSSRSHTIFNLLIEEVFPSKQSYRRMKINLCDLAGSEKIHKGEAMTGAHLQQLKNINLSLTTLGKVIGALSTGKLIAPYRQSKLTRLLQDSLGGNTNTAIIATITSKISCVDQSLNTLKFLERARQVKGEVVAKVYSDNPEMRNLQREINYLRDMLKMKGGHLPTDIQLREKFKHLQTENQKLKEIVDQNLIQKLKRQNGQLRQQLNFQKNDALSDSFLQQVPIYRTLEPDEQNSHSQQLQSISSTGNTNKFTKASNSKQNGEIKRDDSRSLVAKTGQSSMKGSTFKRGTGASMFPSLNRGGGTKAASKILDRIMEIQKVKQQNRLKLQKELQLLQKRSSVQKNENNKTSRLNKKY